MPVKMGNIGKEKGNPKMDSLKDLCVLQTNIQMFP